VQSYRGGSVQQVAFLAEVDERKKFALHMTGDGKALHTGASEKTRKALTSNGYGVFGEASVQRAVNIRDTWERTTRPTCLWLHINQHGTSDFARDERSRFVWARDDGDEDRLVDVDGCGTSAVCGAHTSVTHLNRVTNLRRQAQVLLQPHWSVGP
jgi:hypothetical protein